FMRQRVIVSDFHTDAPGKLLRELFEEVFVLGSARAQRDDGDIFLSKSVRLERNQVESLLIHESRDDADEGPVHIFRGQAKQLEEAFLAGFLSVEIVRRIILSDEGVGSRAPRAVIDAVQDADEAVRAAADDA